MAQLKSGARDAARSNLEQALKSGAAFSGGDEANKTLRNSSAEPFKAAPLY